MAGITSGELEPGRHLVETELSEMLQISRGRLSVRHLDEKEIRDIYAVRAALESLAARTLCELPDRQQVTDSLHQAIDAMGAAASGTMEERIESDL